MKLYTLTSPLPSQEAPPVRPELSSLYLFIASLYVAIFFGAPFWSHAPPFSTMIAIGTMLVVVSLIPFARIRRTFDLALPWIAALGFSWIMALLTLSGRLQFGIQQAMTSRYATFALLLPVAALFLWAVTFPTWPRGVRRMMIVVAALFFAANLYASILSVRDMRNTWIKRRDALAELPYINVHDAEQSKILGELYPDRTRLREMANAYSADGILPPMVKP